ncbi:hypothetical protein GDO86_011142 [Hymenochirus boettgeri]|uniref:protein-tyrosine-phosphatase n=1 Tax=Hymenochirus boettgeri TaxID=247094 RepID=A0A8T2JAJ8_9PIPI|nr:hypothetical protein GDO86_011142 [Hymenochirus boettgeri]
MEKEFTEIDEKNGWNPHYGEIKNKSPVFSNKIAKNPENKDRNRYRDVSPYDHSRVKLQNVENDYINASLVVTEEAQRSYILTQGPLPNTCCHFWLMVWQQKSKAIVMLNRIIEKDTTEEAREIFHFHYTTWPDFGVPVSPASFLKFLFKVRESGSLNLENGPAVVHCSAGIGRSGTFSLVDTCLLLMEKRKDPSSVDIKQVLLNMRNCRMGLIQTPGQLRFSYMAVIEGEKYIMQESSVQRESREGCNGNGILTEDHLKKNSYSDSFNKHQDVVDSNIESLIRKRRREDRNIITAQKVQKIKQTMNEAERKRKRWLYWKPFLIPIGLTTLILSGAYICWKIYIS